MSLLTETQLTKLTITAFPDQSFSRPTGLVWRAMLNPTELSFSRKNRYDETQSAQSSRPEQAYAGGEPDKLQVDLLLDGTGVVGEAGSLAPRLKLLLELTRFQGETHQPYYVELRWGDFFFRGIMSQVDVTYKLFDRTGEPLRAAVKLSLTEALSREEVAAQDSPSSPDLHQTWQVEDGQTLDGIAGEVYGDPALWRPLAAANHLPNPRHLVTGQVLLLPPLERAR